MKDYLLGLTVGVGVMFIVFIIFLSGVIVLNDEWSCVETDVIDRNAECVKYEMTNRGERGEF